MNCLGKGRPALRSGVVVGECKKPVILENATTLQKDTLQFLSEPVRLRILHLAGVPCRGVSVNEPTGVQALPCVEEIG